MSQSLLSFYDNPFQLSENRCTSCGLFSQRRRSARPQRVQQSVRQRQARPQARPQQARQQQARPQRPRPQQTGTQQAGDFERLHPKQTEQLVKIGQDMTKMGQDLTDIGRQITELRTADKSIWAKITEVDKRLSAFSTDVHQKLSNLGQATTQRDAGFGGLFGGMGIMGIIALGVIAVLILKK